MAESCLVDAPAPAQRSLDTCTDQELIAAINGGSSDAFEAVYYRYRDWVVALAYRFTRDNDLALDVLQETFLYFLKKFPGFVLSAQLKTFLYPVVKNLSITARRKADRNQSTETEIAALEIASATETAPGNADAVSLALAHLPDEHRETLWLRFVDGLSLAEIAEALDIPLGTVKSRLHNALDSLRKDPRTKEFFDA